MATVQVRNLDNEAYARLKARAAATGRSLQEYLRMRLEADALRPTASEVLAGVRDDLRHDVPMSEIVAAQRAERLR